MTPVEKYYERKKLEDGNKWFFQVLEDNSPVTLLKNNISDYKSWMNSPLEILNVGDEVYAKRLEDES